MILKGKSFDIHINNLVFVVVPLLFIAGFGMEYLIAFASIAFHELGHIAAARARGCGVKRVTLTFVGLSVIIDEDGLSRRDSFLIFSAGPAANLLLSILSYGFASLLRQPSTILNFFFYSNVCLAVFNLIPAIPLDGGRILRELLARRRGYISAGRNIRKLAFVFSTVFIALGAYQLSYNRTNFSLLVIGIYIMVLLFTGKMEAALMNIKQIIYRRSRLLKKGIYSARDLVAMESTPVNEVLKSMDFDSFHFIFVLDGNLKLIGIFNENEIMEGIVENNTDITFGELLKSSGKGKLIDI